jgi:hypothetical protein
MDGQHDERAVAPVRRGSLAREGRSLWLGASALSVWVALAACGNKGASPPSRPISGEDAGAPQNPSDEPAEPDASLPEREPPAPPSSEEQAEAALGGAVRTDVVALGVTELLQAYCGECHANGENGSGFAGGFAIGELIARGMIVPGSSADSPLVENILHGVLPGSSMRPTVGDVALLTQLIDRMRAEPAPSCARLPFLSVDEAYAAMLADVTARPEAERPFLRYFGVSYSSNAGGCGAALDEQRHALFKLVNSLSTASDIHVPVPIDAQQRLYRIDLRDYRWTRELDLEDDGNVDYPDAWSALVAVAGNPVLELTGPEASALSVATGARVPFLPVNAFVATASLDDLYYALVGIRANLDDAHVDRGIDLGASIEDGMARRAGFVRRPSDELRVTRAPLSGASPGDYWLVEVLTEVRGYSIYGDPLGLGLRDWNQSIFRLPNGLMAFSVNGAQGQRLGTLPRGCLPNCEDPAKDVSVACHGCHAGGLLPMQDTLRDYVTTNRASFDPATFAEVPLTFPSAEELSALIAADNARYLTALDQAGVPRDAADPISRVYLQFTTDPIGLERAAAELGVTPAALREHLGDLPELAALAEPGATIPRSTLAEGSARALCALGTRNRPVSCP